MAVLKYPNQDLIDEAFQPYIMAVGRVAHSWNYLQERFGRLFAQVIGGDSRIAMAVWYSIDSDRGQRKMLRSALSVKDIHVSINRKEDDIGDIIWAIKEADNASDRRNDAIHGPCSLIIESGGISVFPSYFYGNPRAKKLLGTDVISEFVWCEATADVLSKFLVGMISSIEHNTEWPHRPRIPPKPPNKKKSQ